jgi:hypothetical protein
MCSTHSVQPLQQQRNLTRVRIHAAGFPHTTDTDDGNCQDTSIHLTIGIDTHIWGLDYASLRQYALRRANEKVLYNDRDATALAPELYALIYEPLPLGFLAADVMASLKQEGELVESKHVC